MRVVRVVAGVHLLGATRKTLGSPLFPPLTYPREKHGNDLSDDRDNCKGNTKSPANKRENNSVSKSIAGGVLVGVELRG